MVVNILVRKKSQGDLKFSKKVLHWSTDEIETRNEEDLRTPDPLIDYTSYLPTSEEELTSLFEQWMLKHDREYSSPEEKSRRFEIFKETVARVNGRNRKYGAGSTLNNFSYWNETKKSRLYGYCKRPCDKGPCRQRSLCKKNNDHVDPPLDS